MSKLREAFHLLVCGHRCCDCVRLSTANRRLTDACAEYRAALKDIEMGAINPLDVCRKALEKGDGWGTILEQG